MSFHFNDEEYKEISRLLEKNLGPEFLSQRMGPAGKLTYIEGRVAINMANSIFGFNGWNSEVKDCTVDYVDQLDNGRFNVGIAAVVRITLKDGTFHEDIGYGNAENSKTKAAAFEQARKQAITDAMKRTLRIFGNALGNCLYDRSYLTNIGRMANPQIKFNPGDLYRHEQMMEKIKKEEEELNKKNQANQGQQMKQQSQNSNTNHNNHTNQSYRNNQTNQPNHQSFNRNNQPNHNNNQLYQNKQPNTVDQTMQLKKEQHHIPAQVVKTTTTAATVTPAEDSKPETSKKPGLRSPFAQPLVHEDSFCYEGDDAFFLHLADQEALEALEPNNEDQYEEILAGIHTPSPPANQDITNSKKKARDPMDEEFSIRSVKQQRT